VRSSGRISKEIPIILIGDDLGGTVFSERTKTVVLSLHGAGILSKHKLSPEQELILRYPEGNRETEIRVVGQLGTHDGVHTYGVAFVNPNLNFWEIDFPPVSLLERELGLLALFCVSCKTIEKVDDTSIEADICATNDGVMRFCKHCGSSTFWKPALRNTHEASVPVATGQMSLFPSTAPATSPIAPPQTFYDSEVRATTPVQIPVPRDNFSADPSPRRGSAYAAYPEELEEPRAAILTMAVPEKTARPTGIERRKHPRVKVNYSACVRHPQRGDDVVLCEDMSKGGLRFKTRKQYYAQSLIEVAVPYQPGQAAIFVPAQIVFVEELPEQQLYRCGVQYLKPTKAREDL
jgi:PilZ domain